MIDFSGMIPNPTGTTAVATNPGYAKLFAELGVGSLVVGIALVVLIPFLRKLITDKPRSLPSKCRLSSFPSPNGSGRNRIRNPGKQEKKKGGDFPE